MGGTSIPILRVSYNRMDQITIFMRDLLKISGGKFSFMGYTNRVGMYNSNERVEKESDQEKDCAYVSFYCIPWEYLDVPAGMERGF